MSGDLANLVNSSGFLFQWAVEEYVRQTSPEHHWEVVAREFPWATVDGGRSGFVDFIADRFGLHAVFECKRSKDGEWVFLVPEDAEPNLEFRTLWSYITDGGVNELGWGDLHVAPKMLRSELCVVRGASDNDKPMLERIASDLVRSAESVARSQGDTLRRKPNTAAAFIPVIVTNTKLYACRVNPREVDLAVGTLPAAATFEPVMAIKFQKATATDVNQPNTKHRTLHDQWLSKERSVVVVNVAHLKDWLINLSEVASGLSAPPKPWKHLEK
jgi:hypothetical protein